MSKIWAIDPNYYVSSSTQDPGYKFGHSIGPQFMNNSILADKISKSIWVWHNGQVTKDCTGLFIPLPNPATPVYLNANGSISSSPGNHGVTYPSTSYGISFPPNCVETLPVKSTCECGAHKVGSNQHSGWCQMKELA